MQNFSFEPYIDLPYELFGWLGWLILFAGLGFLGLQVHKKIKISRPRKWFWAFVLALLSPITALFIRLDVFSSNLLPLPNLPVENAQPVVVLFFALPWVAAAGLSGPVAAGAVGVISGVWLAFFGTHNLYTPLVVGIVALIYGAAIGQNFRTPFFAFLRHPLGAALLVSLTAIPIYMFGQLFVIPGSFAERLDFALTQNWAFFGARAAELLVASAICELLYYFPRGLWVKPRELAPSPAEISLQFRLGAITLPLVLIMVLVLTLGDWFVAGRSATRMVRDRLSGSAQIAADTMPYFLETGQSLILDLARPELLEVDPQSAAAQINESVRSVPYFSDVLLLNAEKEVVASYDEVALEQLRPTGEERIGIDLALKGVSVQTYPVPKGPDGVSAQISFIAPVYSSAGNVVGVLFARTDLNTNPFTQPALDALASTVELGGEGFILDDNRNILFYTGPAGISTGSDTYVGDLPETASFYENISATGTRQLVYFQPIVGKSWSVVLTVPAKIAQETALQIAFPLLIILVIFTLMAYILVRFGLRTITTGLEKLAYQATLISQGQLTSKMDVTGADEVGRLGNAFENMRVSLKTRMDEANTMLKVTQGVAANLDIPEAIRPVLEASLGEDGVSARVVLIQDVRMELHGDHLLTFFVGRAAESYAHLDSQVFELMRTQEILTISNTSRVRRLVAQANKPHPLALIAFALYHENTYYGTLWIGYEHPRVFTEDEVRFLRTLAAQAALAAANARLYYSAELGRKRLEAVLASTPEPVLVFDDKNQLLLLNPAAMQVPGLVSSAMPGQNAKDVLASPELVRLLTGSLDNRVSSREVSTSMGKIYHASVAPILGEGAQVGKVCVLRDVTHYKELDSIKSDFVATVSHDLRSPLTLMRGYATMLQMMGELSEQQKTYVTKMITGVDNMSRLVNNLLDLGRIEAGISLKLEDVYPEELVDQVVSQLQPQANQKSIQLLVERIPFAERTSIKVDSAMLQQALYNLVDNAIKYTPAKGQVRIKVSLAEEKILFEIHDSGIGIAPLDLPRLFEKFYRSGRREAYEQRGTGLGLAIVKSVVERHQGRVWVDSQLGKGSSFYFELPIQQSQPAQARLS